MTPMEMTSQRFRTALLGFEKQDVRSFLEIAASEMRAILKERQQLLDENEELKVMIEEYREREKNMRDTMSAAQRATEEMKSVAQREGEVIISRAEMSAQRLLDEAQKRQSTLLSEIADLKFKREQAAVAFKNFLQLHLRMLESDDEPRAAPVSAPAPKSDFLLFDSDFEHDVLQALSEK